MAADESVLTLILSGGEGRRLYPLTARRAKAAVPFGGKVRLIDIAVSNCMHSGFKQIYILTQWFAASLHNHVNRTYRLSAFGKEFIEILQAEQTFEHTDWYQGTADAVRRSFLHFSAHRPSHYLILSSDQLYRMNFRDLFTHHLSTGAGITIAAVPVSEDEIGELGVLCVDCRGTVIDFLEKPETPHAARQMKIPTDHPEYHRSVSRGKTYLASMGIYLFDADVLERSLEAPGSDFGREVFPRSIGTCRISSYVFHGFWKDVGTIPAYYETNLSLAGIRPAFNFFDEEWPIYMNDMDLPASKINSCTTSRTITADGCIITGARLSDCVIGPRTIIESGTTLEGVICLGNEHFETGEQKAWNHAHDTPNLGIGRETHIRHTIIDESVRIGERCRIGVDEIPLEDCEREMYCVRNGIIIIPEGTVVPDGTVI